MNRSMVNLDHDDSDTDSNESDRFLPTSKRLCSSSFTVNSSRSDSSSPILVEVPTVKLRSNDKQCMACERHETLLRTFNCPSVHHFCLNCIFNWTQKHLQEKTAPICLIDDCGYRLKLEDLQDLPIAVKDHQILLQLVELKIEPVVETKTNHRLKCDKCRLYIDRQDYFTHHNECQGSDSTIPCETCYCPVLMDDYEQHTLICTNDNNSTLSRFLLKHLKNPSLDEKIVRLFVTSWQKKYRRPIDVYEMIEEFNQNREMPEEACDKCQRTIQLDQFYFVNCGDNHSVCFACYTEHVKSQMNNNQILTCHQCAYHLQDRDLAETRVFTETETLALQEFQNKRVFAYYQSLSYAEDTVDINPSVQQRQPSSGPIATTNSNDMARRRCELCSEQCFYGDIFLLNCDCKICYNCFAVEVHKQRTTTNSLLMCPFCRASIKHNDLGNLRLPAEEIHSIQTYQQGKLFELEHAVHFSTPSTNQTHNIKNDPVDDDDVDLTVLQQQQCLPKYWTLPMLDNVARHLVDPQSTEYKFVADRFHQNWTGVNDPLSFMGPAGASVQAASTVKYSGGPSVQISFSSASMPQLTQNQPGVPPPQIGGAQPAGLLPFPMWPPLGGQLPPPPPPPLSQLQPPPPQQPVLFSPSVRSQGASTAVQLRPSPQQPVLFSPSVRSQGASTAVQLRPPPLPTSQMQPANRPVSLTLPANLNHPGLTIQTSATQSQQPPMPPSGYRRRQARYHRTHHVPMPFPQIPPGHNTQPIGNPSHGMPTIIQIERIQNQRWYKQYLAHECEFRQKFRRDTQKWLFHGCDEQASKKIEMECFNRSYAGQHATALGQGCYFARDASYSDRYAAPDRQGICRMFLVRVLVGNTIQGNSTMRVPPPGYDTTGDGHTIFVTYHDSQAYAEYIISYRR